MPAHVVANWIGHTVQVQNENYAQVDDHHFDRFNNMQSEKVAHIVAQQMVAGRRNASHANHGEQQKTLPIAKSAQKKLGQKTELNALERGSNLAVSPAFQQLDDPGGPHGGPFDAAVLSWWYLRHLIVDCTDLPEATRHDLIRIGNRALSRS